MRVWPGKPYPLGATWDGLGVNFAIFSEHAESVELCLFEDSSNLELVSKIKIREYTDQVWHCYVPDARPGQLYGYQISGPHKEELGLIFNPLVLLVDPYAKLIIEKGLRQFSVVVDTAFTWGDDVSPKTPLNQTVIYEAHLKALTYLRKDIPQEIRGTYLGASSEQVISYLKELGVTALELMPIHQHYPEPRLIKNNLSNFWGYNTLGYFAPDTRFCSSKNQLATVQEFKMMVRALHQADIEVILDVVYNHTAESDHSGPFLSFKGIDNPNYYRLNPTNKKLYVDYTGCGNTLNMQNPRVLQLVMDSLRYWIQEMHIDGFRFDLASALARELTEVDKLGAFFDIIHQDPVISQVKLIAEPWDLGSGGYQVGNFPVLWGEWNGKYRDTVRKFWRGDLGTVGDFATRVTGSSDLYQKDGRGPVNSVNFVTCHDGFTLADLVSYNQKHNHGNKENNQDGTNENYSFNHGVEGNTSNSKISDLRLRQRKNLIATLFLSIGVPMLHSGDELGHTKRGSNNSYCQDNEINWLDWEFDEHKEEFLNFVKRIIKIRKSNPVFTRRKFLSGQINPQSSLKDIYWINPEGKEMSPEEWVSKNLRTIAMLVSGEGIEEYDEKGKLLIGDTVLVIFNNSDKEVPFMLPSYGTHLDSNSSITRRWELQIDTSEPEGDFFSTYRNIFLSNHLYYLRPKSFVLLKLDEPRTT